MEEPTLFLLAHWEVKEHCVGFGPGRSTEDRPEKMILVFGL